MIDRVTLNGSGLYVHLSEISLKGTKSFTHGGIFINLAASTIAFASLPPIPLPEGFVPKEGASLDLQLVGPDGDLRKQTRSGVLLANEKIPGILRIGGMSKTKRKFPAEDGWGVIVLKSRAYFTHPGVETNQTIPEWLKDSIARMKGLWNRLAWLCRDARCKCSPVATEEIVAFVKESILPAIDAFNDTLGISKMKMKHPAKLKTDAPGVDGLWNFVGQLRQRIGKGRPVPDGLLEQVVAFAEQFKADYTPLNDFIKNINRIAEREAKALPVPIDGVPFEEDHRVVELRPYESRPVIAAFKAVLALRKSTKAPWSEGWPRIKYSDNPKAQDWGLHYYFNKAGVDSALLETPKGLPGLSFGPPLKPSNTGHALLKGRAARKGKLRAATISIPGYDNKTWEFRFAVLQHRELPPNSHVKEWKLIYQNGMLWLNLVVELKQPISLGGPLAAGLDIGWRRTESGIRFGTMFEPASQTVRELIIDLQRSPTDPRVRTPFQINMGPTRIEKRYIGKLLPTWKPGEPIPNALEVRKARGKLRSSYKDAAKALLQAHLGDEVPAWFDKAGVKGLIKLTDDLKDDAVVQQIVNNLKQKNDLFLRPDPSFSDRTTRRLTSGAASRMEYGQLQVAHDVCKYLQQKGINRLFTETSFLSKIAQNQDNEDPDSLKKSQKYRQFASVGRFLMLLKNTAIKYGIAIENVSAINTSRICSKCNTLNAGTTNEKFVCSNCATILKQDENAAINLARFGTDPELAEMAFHAKLA
jgi:hypothetical protein